MAAYKVRLAADLDVDKIADYIGERNVSAGRRFIHAARREFKFLADSPLAGAIRQTAPRQLKGLRSWPIKKYRNYLIFYLPREHGVEIVRVLHGAQDVDRVLGES